MCAVDAIYVEDSNILVASSASDSTVRLWLSTTEATDGRRLDHVQCAHGHFGRRHANKRNILFFKYVTRVVNICHLVAD